jgi:multicomponent Na+:H+ antiporter subunit G
VSALAGVLLVLGASFMLLAAVGLVRLPDLYLRMSATSKAATLGASLVLLGAALHFGTAAVAGRSAVIVAFLFLTAPVAAHAIGRAGYRRGSPLWEGTGADELARASREPETAARDRGAGA